MKKSLSALIALFCIGLTGCEALVKRVDNRNPEAFFPSENNDIVIGKLVADCAERGHTPRNVTAYTVTCDIKPNEGADTFANIVYGYGSTVSWFIEYAAYPKNGGTNVIARIHGEINQPMGRKQRLSSENDRDFNQVQERLYALGGK